GGFARQCPPALRETKPTYQAPLSSPSPASLDHAAPALPPLLLLPPSARGSTSLSVVSLPRPRSCVNVALSTAIICAMSRNGDSSQTSQPGVHKIPPSSRKPCTVTFADKLLPASVSRRWRARLPAPFLSMSASWCTTIGR